MQQPALIFGDLALTSTRLPDGSVTAEVARRQDDGNWLWRSIATPSRQSRDRSETTRRRLSRDTGDQTVYWCTIATRPAQSLCDARF
jgi:hypothetical protein